jgi:hypothetical protein
MSFLNVMLLGGAAAFLAPLLIHLLNRSRFQSVDWGAMHLLEAAMHVNSRRFQWENWLLLLLRCLIPILLAFCLARPVLTSLRVAGAGGKKSLVMLLDNSLSMDASHDGDTAFARALQESEALVAVNRSAEIGLWTMGGSPIDALDGTTFDPARVRRSLAKIPNGAGAADISASISAGITQLESMSNPSKQLVLLSDFQASQWASLSDSELDALRAQLAGGKTPIYLSLMRTTPSTSARTASPLENLSISLNDVEGSTILANDTYRSLATVRNFGTQDVENIRVVFSADDQELTSREVSIPAGATQDVAFACEFGTIGWHHIATTIEESAGIAGDNIAQRAIEVVEPTKLLIIDPDGGQDIKHSSGFLQLALAPFRASSTQSSDVANAYKIAVERGDQLNSDNLRAFDVIVMTNVPRLNDRSADAVANFVQRGGGLVIFAGPAIDTAWYNSHWFDQQKLLPLKFGEKRSAAADTPLRFAKQVIQSPLLDIFNGAEAGELSTLEVQQWIELLESPAESSSPGNEMSLSNVVLRLDGGAPLLASRTYSAADAEGVESLGDEPSGNEKNPGNKSLRNEYSGTVLQFGTSCADEWSNLPLRPAYVPLMQRIVATAFRRNLVNANIRTGETLTLRILSKQEKSQGSNALPQWAAMVSGPQELQVPWDSTAQHPLMFGRTATPGLYRVQTVGDLSSTEAIPARYQPQLFTVSLDSSESDLRLLSNDEMQRLADRLGATIVSNTQEFAQVDKQRSDGQEVWRWLLLALVVFLFAEILLGQKITKGAVA